MIKILKVLAITLFLITVLSGCSSDPKAKAGEEGGRCFDDGTCKGDLRCIEGLCVDLGDMADYPDVDPADSIPDSETADDENNDDGDNDENGDDNPDLIDVCGFDIEVLTKEDMETILNCRTITGDLSFEKTDFEEIVLPYLEEAWGYFDITGNPKLKKVSLPKLEYARVNFVINSNPELKTIMFPRFQQVGGNFLIGMNNSLETFSLPELKKAEDGIYVDFNESLKYFEFPKLETVGKELIIYKNSFLESFSILELESARNLIIARNNEIESFDMASFIYSTDITIAYNPLLPTELAVALVEQVKENNEYFDEEDYEICENKDSTVKCEEDYDWDWEEDADENDDGCADGTYACAQNILYKCEDGIWKYVENCSENGLTCDKKQGECV
ncbi:MAG TPA: hypothetical protein ENN58_04010 [bacterium]|nr:hypothetical protein [bacterium]